MATASAASDACVGLVTGLVVSLRYSRVLVHGLFSCVVGGGYGYR